MSQLQRKLTALVAAVFFYSGMAAPSAQAVSASSNPVLTGDAIATITAMSGTVLERGYVNWNEEIWGEPQRAQLNDKLHEGMQVGTGNNSWAEISWPNVKTRAWSNTVFAFMPNQRLVYLTGGEMLFRLDKHRKNKDQDYWVQTKVLQARIRGTTVLVQAQGPVTRFTVMEGTVDVYNRLDGSWARVKPGAVYEIIGYDTSSTQQTHHVQSNNSKSPQPTVAPPKISNYVTDILYDKQENCKMPMFQDTKASTNIYPSNSQALKQHPLLTAGGLIDSMPLIQEEQSNLPGSLHLPVINIPLADSKQLSRVLASAVQIQGVPTKCDYFVGPFVGGLFKLPSLAQNFPPKGMILCPSNIYSALPAVGEKTPSAAPTTALRLPAVPPIIGPMTGTEAATTQPTSQREDEQTSERNKAVFQQDDTEKQLPTEDFPQPPLIQSQKPVVPPSYNPNPAPSAFQPMPGSMPTTTASGLVLPTSAASAAAAVTGTAGTMLSPTTGAPMAITPTGIMPAGMTPAPIAPAGISPTGTISPLTTTLTNTLQNGTIGRTINSITSGTNLR